VFALVALSPRPAAADAYDDALARASTAEKRGDLAAAASALDGAVPLYPQDYAIALRLGWTYFRAGRWADAEHAYRLASTRAPASDDARLGLGWSLAREDRCADARSAFRSLLAGADDAPAREGLVACTPARAPIDVSATFNEYLFPSHPWKASGTGTTVSTATTIADRWTVGGAYRYVRFSTLPTSTQGPFAQNEGYLDVGLSSRALGITARAAVVADGTGALGTSPHVGLSGRWSPAGDLLLDATVSAYPDGTVLRGAARWRIPVAGPFFVEPGVAAQDAEGRAFPAATLAASLVWPRVTAWVGGTTGEQVRPALLDAHVVYDLPEHVLGGASAGLRVRLVREAGVVATYAFDWLRRTDALGPSESGAHAFALGAFLDL
jgi:hypothetical protein